MFTDDVATPVRLEVLFDVLRAMRSEQRTVDVDLLVNLLQPDGLTDLKPNRPQAREVLKAATQLGVVIQEEGEVKICLPEQLAKNTTRQILLSAFDQNVLSRSEIEPYFAKFYSYTLENGSYGGSKTRPEWVAAFKRDVFNDAEMANQFNETKLSGIHRWLTWAGLGWYDSRGEFVCNPYARLKRVLPQIFGDSLIMDDEQFVACVGVVCPELDTGTIFREATSKHSGDHRLTVGVSQALLDLHLDGTLILHAPQDSAGWGLELAHPTELEGSRLHSVELLKRKT